MHISVLSLSVKKGETTVENSDLITLIIAIIGTLGGTSAWNFYQRKIELKQRLDYLRLLKASLLIILLNKSGPCLDSRYLIEMVITGGDVCQMCLLS